MSPVLPREERDAIRALHSDTYPDPGHSTAVCCAACDEWPPCKTIRLLDALDAAEAENEQLRATYGLDRDDKHPCIRVEAYLRLKAERDAARAEVERLRAVSAAQPYETERELVVAYDEATAMRVTAEAERDAARAETEQYRRNEVTLTGELSRARQDAAEFCGQRDEARAALAALRERIEEFAAAREQALPGFVRQLRALAAARPTPDEGRAEDRIEREGGEE